MEVRFVIVVPAKSRKTYKVRLPCDVGRGDETKFRIQQDSVSRRHCVFQLEEGVVTVTDLGSTNGTFLAGARLAANAPTPVSSGAEVRIGGIVIRIEYAASSAVAAPRVDETVSLPASAAAGDDVSGELPELEPVAEELPELVAAEPAAEPPQQPTTPASEPVPQFTDVEPAAPAAAAPAFADVEPAAAAAETDFAALAGAEPAPAPAEGSFDFLAAEAAPAPADDDKLEDFFKSLS